MISLVHKSSRWMVRSAMVERWVLHGVHTCGFAMIGFRDIRSSCQTARSLWSVLLIGPRNGYMGWNTKGSSNRKCKQRGEESYENKETGEEALTNLAFWLLGFVKCSHSFSALTSRWCSPTDDGAQIFFYSFLRDACTVNSYLFTELAYKLHETCPPNE